MLQRLVISNISAKTDLIKFHRGNLINGFQLLIYKSRLYSFWLLFVIRYRVDIQALLCVCFLFFASTNKSEIVKVYIIFWLFFQRVFLLTLLLVRMHLILNLVVFDFYLAISLVVILFHNIVNMLEILELEGST